MSNSLELEFVRDFYKRIGQFEDSKLAIEYVYKAFDELLPKSSDLNGNWDLCNKLFENLFIMYNDCLNI